MLAPLLLRFRALGEERLQDFVRASRKEPLQGFVRAWVFRPRRPKFIEENSASIGGAIEKYPVLAHRAPRIWDCVAARATPIWAYVWPPSIVIYSTPTTFTC